MVVVGVCEAIGYIEITREYFRNGVHEIDTENLLLPPEINYRTFHVAH